MAHGVVDSVLGRADRLRAAVQYSPPAACSASVVVSCSMLFMTLSWMSSDAHPMGAPRIGTCSAALSTPMPRMRLTHFALSAAASLKSASDAAWYW
ncbi:hypothetical protein ACFQ0Q_29700 [Streptomyces aureus]